MFKFKEFFHENEEKIFYNGMLSTKIDVDCGLSYGSLYFEKNGVIVRKRLSSGKVKESGFQNMKEVKKYYFEKAKKDYRKYLKNMKNKENNENRIIEREQKEYDCYKLKIINLGEKENEREFFLVEPNGNLIALEEEDVEIEKGKYVLKI